MPHTDLDMFLLTADDCVILGCGGLRSDFFRTREEKQDRKGVGLGLTALPDLPQLFNPLLQN